MEFPVTVHIVDDDVPAARRIAAVAASFGLNAQTYSSAEDFLERYDEERPGCVICDWSLPGMSGSELQQKLLQFLLPPPFILISAYVDIRGTIVAMRAGAVTVLEKPCEEGELKEAIRLAVRIEHQQRAEAQSRVAARRRLALLSPREQEVLACLMDGLGNKQIAACLHLGLRTVELARSTLFRKTETNSVAQLVRLVLDARATDDAPRPLHRAEPRPHRSFAGQEVGLSSS